MKRRNAFTLIELLAVIVILAIIALIAVPVVMNIINKVQKSSFKDSAYGVIKTGELYYTNQLLGPTGMNEDKIFIFPDDIDDLQIDGSKPTNGTMMINKKGDIALAITDGKYCVTKKYNEDEVNIIESFKTCFMPYSLGALATTSETLGITEIDPCIEKGVTCAFGKDVEEPTSFAIQVNDNEVYKFYVINDTGSEVTLIMDRNLGKAVAWISESDYIEANKDDKTSCSSTACNDEGPITALNSLKQRTSNWLNILERTYTIVDDSGGNKYSDIIMSTRARMLTKTEALNLGCTTVRNGDCPKYLYEKLDAVPSLYGYWLSTASSSKSINAWNMDCYSYIRDDSSTSISIDTAYSIRPVITLTK